MTEPTDPYRSPFDYAEAEHDTDKRMQHDTEFRTVVEYLAHVALTRGYTPGELRQIAFAAAVLVEMRRMRPIRLRMEGGE